jgi:hypothetical protein
MHVPTKTFKTLFHIGDLTAQPAVGSRSSLEGPCLSVSQVPNAWRTIAQLGAAPLWELSKEGNTFLNVLRMSKPLKKAVVQWGCKKGFVQERLGWITEFYDEEGEIRISHSESQEKAVADWGEGEDEIAKRYSQLMAFATEKLEAYVRQKVELSLVTDMLTIAYAEQVLNLDGLYWGEILDVCALSAPRAGIFPSRLSEWSITRSKSDVNPNEEEY